MSIGNLSDMNLSSKIRSCLRELRDYNNDIEDSEAKEEELRELLDEAKRRNMKVLDDRGKPMNEKKLSSELYQYRIPARIMQKVKAIEYKTSFSENVKKEVEELNKLINQVDKCKDMSASLKREIAEEITYCCMKSIMREIARRLKDSNTNENKVEVLALIEELRSMMNDPTALNKIEAVYKKTYGSDLNEDLAKVKKEAEDISSDTRTAIYIAFTALLSCNRIVETIGREKASWRVLYFRVPGLLMFKSKKDVVANFLAGDLISANLVTSVTNAIYGYCWNTFLTKSTCKALKRAGLGTKHLTRQQCSVRVPYRGVETFQELLTDHSDLAKLVSAFMVGLYALYTRYWKYIRFGRIQGIKETIYKKKMRPDWDKVKRTIRKKLSPASAGKNRNENTVNEEEHNLIRAALMYNGISLLDEDQEANEQPELMIEEIPRQTYWSHTNQSGGTLIDKVIQLIRAVCGVLVYLGKIILLMGEAYLVVVVSVMYGSVFRGILSIFFSSVFVNLYFLWAVSHRPNRWMRILSYVSAVYMDLKDGHGVAAKLSMFLKHFEAYVPEQILERLKHLEAYVPEPILEHLKHLEAYVPEPILAILRFLKVIIEFYWFETLFFIFKTTLEVIRNDGPQFFQRLST
ncbi:hypothetical protein GAYE_SCF55G6319 [Galdieria yellowstonensis]|uniref:Uncharacterized protein n=1 Tax=Galdieria yellowstonensis TaxID=3028027 RepID=A0AAV9ILL4_9RHOD|nr:hypothetical protein GAYE_SCF55G6319 [Galdieria yellowstonensis]